MRINKIYNDRFWEKIYSLHWDKLETEVKEKNIKIVDLECNI